VAAVAAAVAAVMCLTNPVVDMVAVAATIAARLHKVVVAVVLRRLIWMMKSRSKSTQQGLNWARNAGPFYACVKNRSFGKPAASKAAQIKASLLAP